MDDTITVEITYSPQPYDIGAIREMPADEARLLIREGRAVRHYPAVPDVDTQPIPTSVRLRKPRTAAEPPAGE